MKHRHSLTICMSFLMLLLSWSGLAKDADCQSIDTFFPTAVSEQDLPRLIAAVKSKAYAAENEQFVKFLMQFQLDVLKSELDLHEGMKSGLEIRKEKVDRDSWQLTSTNSDEIELAERESGMPMVDRDTTALLMRNCVSELQRIEWELAVEKGLPEPKANDSEARINEQILRLDEERDTIEKEIADLKRDIIKKLDIDTAMKKLRERLKYNELQVFEARSLLAGLLRGTPSADSAARVSQLAERKKVILEQLELLKKQRKSWGSIERRQVEVNNLRKHSEAIAGLQMQSELQQISRSNAVHAIEEALKACESRTTDVSPNSEK